MVVDVLLTGLYEFTRLALYFEKAKVINIMRF